MIFTVWGEKVWRGYVLFTRFKIQLIADWCAFGYGDFRRFSVFTLWPLNALLAAFTGIALFALGTGFTFFTLWPLNALFAAFAGIALFALDTGFTLVALWTLYTLFTLRAGAASVALNALRADFTLQPLFSDRSLLTDGAALTFFAAVALGSYGTLWTGVTFRPDGTAVTLWTNRTRVALDSLEPDFSRVALWAAVSANALGPARSHRSYWTS